MKKILLGACAALLIAGASCAKGSDEGNADKMPKSLSDSISVYSGRTLGASVLSDYINYLQNSNKEYSKDAILKGIQLAFANSQDESVQVGMQLGTQLYNNLRQLEDQGVEIDYNLFLKNFREQFMAETFDRDSLAADNGVMNELHSKMQAFSEERERKANAQAIEDAAIATQEYVLNLRNSDPEVKISESGLVYKVIDAGTEPRVQDNSQILVNYTGKLIDGTVFDQSPEGKPATFSPGSVIPGFSEGLKLLGKGGKAVFYIPGELAYGQNGIPQAGIGPNAMLIFEVEVVDVTNPEN